MNQISDLFSMIPWQAPILLVLFFLAAFALKARLDRKMPYIARNVMTPTELKLYQDICRALPDNIILAQVQISRIMEVKASDNREHSRYRNRLWRQSVDYLVLYKNGETLAAIELLDATHERPDLHESDVFKRAALAAVDIPLLTFEANKLPSVGDIQEQFWTLQAKNRNKENRGNTVW